MKLVRALSRPAVLSIHKPKMTTASYSINLLRFKKWKMTQRSQVAMLVVWNH